MRFKAPESVGLTPIMEKKARLEILFRNCLNRRADTPQTAFPPILLLAHSLDSPVAMAVENLVLSQPQRITSVRMILTRLETPFMSAGAIPAMRPGVTCRVLRDPRFLYAHEQVVLGNASVWTGDCMRRDPAKRDCFESFFENDAAAAANAMTSFERLWAIALPVRSFNKNASLEETAALNAAAAIQIAGADLPLHSDTATRR
jgi:hypothetical protein